MRRFTFSYILRFTLRTASRRESKRRGGHAWPRAGPSTGVAREQPAVFAAALACGIALGISSVALAAGAPPANECSARDRVSRQSLLELAEQLAVDPSALAFAIVGPTGLNLEHRAELALKPASTLKLLTSVAALSLLGCDYSFATELGVDGPVEAGVLNGNLRVLGRGSPTVVERDADPLAVFKGWSQLLQRRGIRAIRGRVLAEHGYLAGEHRHADWPRDQWSQWYCAPSGSLNVCDNCLTVELVPSSSRARVDVRLSPSTSLFRAINKLAIARRPTDHVFSIDRKPLSSDIVVSGRFLPTSGIRQHWVAIDDPTQFYLDVLQRVLAESGIEVMDQLSAAEEAERRASIEWIDRHALPLPAVLPRVLKDSQNLYADCLLRVVGRERGGDGSFASGTSAVKKWLFDQKLVVEPENLELRDGSGLSHRNSVSATLLVRVLQLALAASWGTTFQDALAESGVDGTLKRRFRESPLAGRVRAKTGHLNGVTALAGYLETAAGPYCFAFLYNGPATSVPQAQKWQERALEAVFAGVLPAR